MQFYSVLAVCAFFAATAMGAAMPDAQANQPGGQVSQPGGQAGHPSGQKTGKDTTVQP